ncbi:tRNA1(Val) (adenine(37)-N6)-methyltransferase [Vallitalea guaymasensis]|uniref:tRNA1(Val) (Adenine(37)-N6)-methyltransferase n=1 Tax=Vallitalea guaymasensis TaxID=1185412 RepID=A0A8J8MAK3_9FIRM|nr:tRNA1(Val) (adenine(37)-N6)-methyltransferase [Vallitalea guaymasensis]QUH29382.1 tRNA1(Val) (adenine(37)-N6)-methyltransferase [Vallitalea guaymasensis]
MELKKGERIDELHRNGYRIIQNTGKFCFGIDAVLLTGFAVVKEKETVLDLGTGTGIIPILLEAKTKGNHFTGLEIQEESVEMADRSVKLNCLEDKISIVKGDIKEAVKLFPLSSFDVITSNPPYMNNKNGIKNDLQPKSIARHEILCTLDDVIKNTASLLKVGGRFYMVHRPSRLPEIIVTLKKYKLEPKRIRLVHPYIDKEPNMVLIESVRHGKPLLKVEPPLIVYESVGKYTDEIYDIYGYNQ